MLRTEDMLRNAFDMGVRRFCIDSAEQARQITELCDAGMSGEKTLWNCFCVLAAAADSVWIKRRQCSVFISVIKICRPGLSGFITIPGRSGNEVGKLRRDLEYFQQALNGLSELPGFDISEIQIGCGIGFPYFVGEKKEKYAVAMDEAAMFVKELRKKFKVIYEAGRCVASSAGVYVTKVFQIKDRENEKILFCLGGTNHLQYPGRNAWHTDAAYR